MVTQNLDGQFALVEFLREIPFNQLSLFLVVLFLSFFIIMFEHFDGIFSMLYERITLFSCVIGALCSTISKYRSSTNYGKATTAKLDYFRRVNQSRSTVTLPQNPPQRTQKLSDLEPNRFFGVLQIYSLISPLLFFAWWRLRVSILVLIMVCGGSGLAFVMGAVVAEISYCGSSASEYHREYRRRSVLIANKSSSWILTNDDEKRDAKRERKVKFAEKVMSSR